MGGCPEPFRINVRRHELSVLEFFYYTPVAVAFQTLPRFIRMTPFFCADRTEIKQCYRQQEQNPQNHLSHFTLPIKGAEAIAKGYLFDAGSGTCLKHRVIYRPSCPGSPRTKDTLTIAQNSHMLMGLLISRFRPEDGKSVQYPPEYQNVDGKYGQNNPCLSPWRNDVVEMVREIPAEGDY
jgi:hypothetical protein